jgi:hypothetical protein
LLLENLVSVDVGARCLRVLGVEEDLVVLEHTIELLDEGELIGGRHSQTVVITSQGKISTITFKILSFINYLIDWLLLFRGLLLLWLRLLLCFLLFLGVNANVSTLFKVVHSGQLELFGISNIFLRVITFGIIRGCPNLFADSFLGDLEEVEEIVFFNSS